MNLIFSTKRRGKSKLNERLVKEQNLTESDVAEIIKLHRKKDRLLDKIEETGDRGLLKKIEDLEYLLQDAWGFERNAMFHKHWEIPGCSCPVLDSIDDYPYLKHYSGGCELHGLNAK